MALTQLILAARTLLTEPTNAEGDIVTLSTNKAGRLRVAAKAGLYSQSVGNLVNNNDALIIDVSEASVLQFHIKNTGTATLTAAAGLFIFEGSIDSTNGTDGTWFGMQAVRSNSNTVDASSPALTINAGSATGNAWKLAVNAVNWFRVRLTGAVTTSSIATVTAIRGSFAAEPAPAIQTHAVTTSGTVTNTPVTGTAYGMQTAATTNAALIKASAATLYEISVINLTAATIYVKLYNMTTAPTVGTSTPREIIPVAAGASFGREYGAIGKRLDVGLSIAVTANAATSDTTAVAAGALISATYI